MRLPLAILLLGISPILAQSNPGPGLGNLTYATSELGTDIASISEGTDHPFVPPGAPKTHYGMNTGAMANGYFVTVFAYDSGNTGGGLLFYDMSDPRNIVQVKQVYEPAGRTADIREIHSMAFANIGGAKYMVIQSYQGIHLWDLADVNNPQLTGKLDFTSGGDYSNTPWQLVYQHPYVYVSGTNQGIFIVDVSDPTTPVLADRGPGNANPIPVSELGGFRVGPIFLMGNRMLITSMDNTSGFSQLDLGDPLHPRLTSTVPGNPQKYYSVAYDGNHFTTAPIIGNGKMEVYDVSDPAAITFVGESAPLSGTQVYCAIQDHYSFQGATVGTHKMDISDPANPVTAGFIPSPPGVDSADQVTLFGNLAFLGSDHGPTSVFTVHQTAADTTPPAINAMSPADGSTGNPICSRVGISFSDNIDLDSVSAATFELRPLLGGTIPGDPVTGVFTSSLNILNFSPDSSLLPNTLYQLHLPASGIQDWAGNGVAAFTATFTTGDTCAVAGGTTPTPGLSLVHHWPLESDASDIVGTNHGSFIGDAVIDNGSLLLDGAGDYLDLPQDLATVLGADASLSFHIQTTAGGSDTFWDAPGVTGIEESGGGNDIFWGILDAAGRIAVQRGNGAAARSTDPINDGLWHHVVMTRDASSGELKLYLDGELEATAAGETGGSLGFQQIGRVADTGGSPVDLDARLKQMRVYQGVMSASDVNRVVLEESLTHHWPLDTDAEDVVTSVHGTMLNGANISSGCLVLDGTDNRLDLPGPHTGELAETDGTISFLLNTTQTGNDLPWLAPGVMGADDTSGGNDVFIGYLDSAGHLGIQAGNGPAALSTSVVNDGGWHHIVLTRTVADGTLRVYVDGTLESELTGDPGAKTTPFSSMGRIEIPGSAGNHLDGCLRDVRVFGHPLTAAQITTLRNDLALEASSPGPAPAGATVNLTATADGFGEILYSWDFGDGNLSPASSTPNVSHTYTAPGHYQVTVTATNGTALRAESFLQTIHRVVTPGPPTRSSTLVVSGGTGFAVNSDNSTLTAVDGASGSVLWEMPTGSHPRTATVAPDGRLWVANQDDATVTIHHAGTGAIEQVIPLPRASRPFGIVFAPDGSAAFVSLEATGEVARISPAGVVELTTSAGPWPRGLAVSADSSRLFVTRFLSPDAGAEIRELDPDTLAPVRTFTLPLDTATIDSSFASRGVPNYLNTITLSPDGTTAWIPSKKDNIERGQFRDGQALTFETSVRPIVSGLDLVTNAPNGNLVLDLDDRAMPSAVVFTPLGDYAFVATEGTNTIEILDAYAHTSLGNIFVQGLAPRGLALSDDGALLYVQNFMTRSLEIYDVTGVRDGVDFAPPRLATTSLVSSESLAADILLGKQIFYNAADGRMTQDGYISCAVCHDDGGDDGRVWDFTDRGEGLRNTTVLNGRGGTAHGPVHWSGNFDEIQDFEHDIRNAFNGTGFLSNAEFNTGTRNTTLGDPKAGVSALLDALAAYVTSLDTVPESPHRNTDGTLTDAALRGREVFLSLDCASCHSDAPFTDSALNLFHDVGTITAASGQRLGLPLTGLDTPTLKGVWQSAPYLHDGSAATLLDVLTTANPSDEHGSTSTLTGSQRDDLVAYLQQLEESSEPGDVFDEWRHANFSLTEAITPGLTGFFDNPDSDSLTNGFEFLLDTPPSTPNPGPKLLYPQPDGSMLFSIAVDPDAASLFNFQVLESPKLQGWTPIPPESFSITPQGAFDLYEISWPAGDPGHYFRLSLQK